MRLAVVGTGLIGASAAMAFARREGAEVVLWDRDPGTLAEAVDVSGGQPAESLQAAVEGAEAILVAAPVGVLPGLVTEVLRHAGEDALVTDVGSTKQGVVAANPDPRFVGGHPLAGGESGGPGNARADLFESATWYLTPIDSTAGVQLERAFRLVSDLGARPRAIGPHVHDRILATVSHLPHVLANLLVAEADATLSEEGEPLPATGPSFRDSTRVAGAPSSIWTDIYLSNSEALIKRIEGVERRLGEVREMLAAGDADGLTGWNDLAAEQRSRVSEQAVSGGPAQPLRVAVPNRAGVLAEIALALGGAGIDLVDLQLHPAADRTTGTIVLWIEGSEAKDRAAQLIADLGHTVV